MRYVNRFALLAGLLAVPAAGTAQVATHVSIGIGLAATSPHTFSSGPGLGLAYQPLGEGPIFGFGLTSYGDRHRYDDDYGFGHHGGWGPSHCWDYFCPRYFGVGYGPFGWWSWHRPWWGQFGFLGWPSPRYLRNHWYAFSPYWYGGYSDWHGGYSGWYGGWDRYPGYRGWGWGSSRFRRYYAYDGYGGRVTRYGYDSERAVRRSPLFGPRYKERPSVYVTDNGPERPVSRLTPGRGRSALAGIAGVGDRNAANVPPTRGARTARPRGGTEVTRPATRTANPRPATRRPPVGTRNSTPARTSPPKVRKRPDTAPRIGSAQPRGAVPRANPITPRRQPAVRTTTPRRQPSVRTTTPRRQPAVRTTTPRRQPSVRTAPPKRQPSARAPSRRPAPKVRSAPPRRSPPKARPAPRGSAGSKARPKRSPPRRRGG